MKAAVNKNFGPAEVIQMTEIEKPQIDEDEVLIRVHTTSVNTIDIVFRSGMKVMFGLIRFVTGIRSPKKEVLGFDFSGEIVEVGSNVDEFNIGDQVFGGSRSGANAEFTRTGAENIVEKPYTISHIEAGVMPLAALSALQGLRDSGEIKQGQEVLIYGASGGIGTYAVQLAKHYGARVTGVASGKNEGLVRSLGSDDFKDYTKEDFFIESNKYDLIFDTVGKYPFKDWQKGLKRDGIFVDAGSPSQSMTRSLMRKIGNSFRNRQFRSFYTEYSKADLEFLSNLANEGNLKSIIDKSYSLDEITEAHKYYELGHTAGKVAVIVREDTN